MIEFDPDMELEWWVGPDVEIKFEGGHDCVCLHGPGYRPKECGCSVYVDSHGRWCGNENCRRFLG